MLQKFFFLGKWFALLLLVSGVWCVTPAFTATQLNTLWEYRMSGGEDTDNRNDFFQRYNLNTGFFHQPTNAIFANANLGYNWNQLTGGPFSEVITPSASLGVINDIFTADLSGSVTRSQTEEVSDTSSYNWEGTLGSGWYHDWWPRLSLYYGETGYETGKKTKAVPTEYAENHYGLNVDLDLKTGELYYGYLNSHSEDRLNQSQTDTTSHFGRLETDGKFLQDKLIIKLTQSFNNISENFSARIPEDGNLPRDLNLQTYAILDPRPWIPDPGFVDHELTLNLEPGLRNQQTLAISLTPEQRWHMGVSGIFEGGTQQINQLRVYVDDPLGELNSYLDALQWDLYVSLDNTNWEPVPNGRNVLAFYDSAEQRFEIDIPDLIKELGRPYDYLKLVVSRSDVMPPEITVKILALQAIRFLLGIPGSLTASNAELTGYNADINMRLRMSNTLTFSSNVELDRSENSSSSSRLAFDGNLRWVPTPKVAPSLGVSEIRRETDNFPDIIDRTYNITFPFYPLPTLNVTLSTTQLETYTGDRRTFSRNSYNLNTIAILFPDLHANLGVNYSTTNTLRSDDTTTGRNTLSGTMGLLARLSPKLTADLIYTAEKNERTEIQTSRIRSNTSLNLVYRPSDYLYTRLITTKYWYRELPDSIDFKVDLALVRTETSQINLIYRLLESDGRTDSAGFTASWDLSQIFTLQCRTRYTVGEVNEWRITTSLYMNVDQ